MGVTLGVYGATDATGWTTFTASGTPQDGYNSGPPASGNTMIIHVSSSVGKDPGDVGFVAATQGSSSTPYRTLTKAFSMTRNGEADWVLLRKGDTWTESVTLANANTGKSATEPQVYAGYDPANPNVVDPATGGARPIIQIDSVTCSAAVGAAFGTGGNASTFQGGNFLAFVGLDIYGYTRDPVSGSYNANGDAFLNSGVGGIGLSNHFDWALIENCRIRFTTQNIAADANGGGLFYTYRFTVSPTVTVTQGAVYSNNGTTFEVQGPTNGGTLLAAWRLGSSGSPAASGTLTLVSGTGDATVAFSAVVNIGFSNNLIVRRCSPSDSYTINRNGAATHNGGILNQTFDENCIDHEGYVWIANSPMTFSLASSANATSGAVYTNNGNNYTVTSTISGGTTLQTTADNGWPTDNGVTGTLTKVSGTGDATITFNAVNSGGVTTTAALTIPGQYGFNHNVYLSQFADEYDNSSYVNPVLFRGNIDSRNVSQDQTRVGATTRDTLFLASPDTQSGALSNDVIYDRCVVLEAQHNPGYAVCQGLNSGAAPHYDRGNASITNCIIAHSKNASASAAINVSNSPNGIVSNNVIYDWSGAAYNIVNGGIEAYGAITGGSGGGTTTFTGYVDDGTTITFTVTAAHATQGATYTNNGQTFTVRTTISGTTTLVTDRTGADKTALPTASGTLTLASGTGDATIAFSSFAHSAVAPDGSTCNVLNVTSISGTPLTTNQKYTAAGAPSDIYNQAQRNGTTGGVGQYLLLVDQRNTAFNATLIPAGTTFTIASYYMSMSYAAGHSGNGSGATAYVTVDPGGVNGVTSCILFPAHAMIGWAPGQNYAGGDVLTGAVPGVTGWSVLVGSVRNTTTTGNQIDANADGVDDFTGLPLSFPDPTRTIERYDSEILGGPGTLADFLTKAKANYKGNWDPRLTARQVNQWIAAGFGLNWNNQVLHPARFRVHV